MLEELVRSRLEVRKVPAPKGYNGHIRMAIDHNAEWYRKFCRAYTGLRRKRKYRRPRTVIRRCHTITHLTKLVQHGPIPNLKLRAYQDRLLEAIEEYGVELSRQYGVKIL